MRRSEKEGGGPGVKRVAKRLLQRPFGTSMGEDSARTQGPDTARAQGPGTATRGEDVGAGLVAPKRILIFPQYLLSALCRALLFSAVLCCFLLFPAVVCCSLLFFAVRCCSLLVAAVLSCSMLCSAASCCSLLFSIARCLIDFRSVLGLQNKLKSIKIQSRSEVAKQCASRRARALDF